MTQGESPGATRQDGVAAAIQALVRGANIEVIPLRGIDEKLQDVASGATVTVTCSPKLGLSRTLDCAVRAARAGFTVVPHLAARQLADEAELRGFVARLADAGITGLYVIGGDAAQLGVGSSVRYLAKQHGFLSNVLKGAAYQPESLLYRMGDAVISPALGIDRLHLFSFNQVAATVQWQDSVGSPMAASA